MNEVLDFTAALHLAAKALQFYTAEHPRGAEALATLDHAANELLAQRPRVSIVAAKGTLLVDGQPLGEEAVRNKAHVKALSQELEARQFGGIILLRGLTYRELVELVRLFVMKPPQLREAGGAEEIFRRADVTHIRISRVRYEAITEGEEVVWSKTARLAEAMADRDPQEIAAMVLETMRNETETEIGLPSDAQGLALLRARLEELGISREQLDEIIGVISWDRLSTSERMEKLLAGSSAIFDLPREKLVVFIRELLEQRQYDEVFRLLETYARGLEQEAIATRQNVIDTFGQIASLIESPGTSAQIEQLLTRVILNHFVKESDARMQTTVAEAVASLCMALVKTGRADVALRTMTRLEAAVAVADPEAAVQQSHKSLGRAFGEPRRAAQMIAQIYAADPEVLAKAMLPLVAQLGEPLLPALMEALANEDDRNRRGRLVRALKAIGKPAHPFLLDALESPQWFVVRNILTILGEIGERDHAAAIGKKLQYGDARVRRAAARALGKIGGGESEALLVAAIGDRDAETQSEVLLCLGSMKAQSAVPALSELVRPRRMFARQQVQTRLAAARALAAIATPDARDALRSAIAAENDRGVRDALAKILTD